MTYLLYSCPDTRSMLCEMVFAEVGVPFERKIVDIHRDEHRAASYLAVNPAGWVPALETPAGQVLYETPAINLYLAERYGLGNIAPDWDDPDRGPFLSGLFYLSDELEPALKRYFYPQRYAVRRGDEEAVLGMARESIATTLSAIENRLEAGGPYHLGDRYSLVDLILGFWVVYIHSMDRPLVRGFASVWRCVDRVRQRQALAPLFDRHVAQSNAYASQAHSSE